MCVNHGSLERILPCVLHKTKRTWKGVILARNCCTIWENILVYDMGLMILVSLLTCQFKGGGEGGQRVTVDAN